MRTVSLLLLCGLLAGCERPHQYQIERVKDVNDNEVFLRIDKTTGDECAIGKGFAIVRHGEFGPYTVPFCNEQPATKTE
jgi:hypothetical protein